MPQPIPDGYHSVTPYLIVDDAVAALDFYREAFNAEELFRVPVESSKLGHAEIKIGNSRVMLADEFPDMGFTSPKTLGGAGVSLMIYTEDVDALFAQAIGAGATELKPLIDQFYGDRAGTVKDPFGHTWTLATHIEDVTPEQVAERAASEC